MVGFALDISVTSCDCNTITGSCMVVLKDECILLLMGEGLSDTVVKPGDSYLVDVESFPLSDGDTICEPAYFVPLHSAQ